MIGRRAKGKDKCGPPVRVNEFVGFKQFLEVFDVKIERDAELPQVGRANGAPSALFRAGKSREQKAGENCNNRDNDEQLDQSERAREPKTLSPGAFHAPIVAKLSLTEPEKSSGRKTAVPFN